MNRPDVSIGFSNLDLDPASATIIRQTVDEIYFFSPSDSSLKIHFEKAGDACKVTCTVTSVVGRFVSEGFAETPIGALAHLRKRLLADINRWKKHRFLKDALAS